MSDYEVLEIDLVGKSPISTSLVYNLDDDLFVTFNDSLFRFNGLELDVVISSGFEQVLYADDEYIFYEYSGLADNQLFKIDKNLNKTQLTNSVTPGDCGGVDFIEALRAGDVLYFTRFDDCNSSFVTEMYGYNLTNGEKHSIKLNPGEHIGGLTSSGERIFALSSDFSTSTSLITVYKDSVISLLGGDGFSLTGFLSMITNEDYLFFPFEENEQKIFKVSVSED